MHQSRVTRVLFHIVRIWNSGFWLGICEKGEEWWDGCCVDDRRCRTTGPAVHLVQAMGISKETLL